MISAVCIVFFKQKTAYEMRISDWSSDVCSSDLYLVATRAQCQASNQGIRKVTTVLFELPQRPPNLLGLINREMRDAQQRFHHLHNFVGVRLIAGFQHPKRFDQYHLRHKPWLCWC